MRLRSLVVSDLHLGARSHADVLRDARSRAPLLQALADCDRLVLLGDLLELRHGPVRDALGAAEQPLREIGAALGPDREVVIVAGNHDYHLIDGWAGRRAAHSPPPALGHESAVSW
ncbi:MAG: metallophosphoesterase, partial [Solirubrobacteraceae bacterium]